MDPRTATVAAQAFLACEIEKKFSISPEELEFHVNYFNKELMIKPAVRGRAGINARLRVRVGMRLRMSTGIKVRVRVSRGCERG